MCNWRYRRSKERTNIIILCEKIVASNFQFDEKYKPIDSDP